MICPNCNFVIKDDTPWLTCARTYLGQKEVVGLASNKWILSLWDSIPWIWSTVSRTDDSVLPWCGAFVRHCLLESKITPPKNWFRAKAYIDFGTKLDEPIVGCIGVIKTGKQYHVGIIVGVDNNGNILMIGGNQADSVKVSAFKANLFQYYGWPVANASIIASRLPVLSAELAESVA